ncbi:MAG: transposase [Lachnospiraceae bacterium]|nr:transposase [Lachnospiraceae bacterium]
MGKDALIILVSSLQSQFESANAMLADNIKQINLLTEQIRILNQRHFGKKSESNLSSMNGQLSMFDSFNEAENLKDPNLPEPEITEVIISSYKRSKTKGKRDEDLDGLPARIIEHKLSEEELNEKFLEGYRDLPAEIYKRLHIIPETFIVDEHHIHVYASKSEVPKHYT